MIFGKPACPNSQLLNVSRREGQRGLQENSGSSCRISSISGKDETPSLLEPSHDENLLNSTKTPTPSSRQGVRFATQVAFPVALLPEAEALVSRAWEAKKSAQAAKAARRAKISANAQSTLPQATVIHGPGNQASY